MAKGKRSAKAGSSRKSKGQNIPPRRSFVGRVFGALMLLLLLGAVGVAALAYDGWTQINQPMQVEQPVRVMLDPGTGMRAAVTRVGDQGLWPSARTGYYLELWARLHRQAGRIQAGEYEIKPGATPLTVLGMWVAGTTVLHEIQFVEGIRFSDALKLIRQSPAIRQTHPDADPAQWMALLGEADVNPEGQLFPDTYRFTRGTTDLALIKQAHEAMQKVLDEAWAARAPGLPYDDPAQALTMASIIEKETGVPEERPEIAGVFVRRLQLGMRLQTDPTVIYGMGDSYHGNIRKVDLQTDTAYNTYTRAGLPPSPICLPGKASIEAALHPAAGDALYFVARGNGTHQFSATLSEHDAAVRKYQLHRGTQ